MKRAVFKLGMTIDIQSTYQLPASERQAFKVPISVSDWLRDQTSPWTFSIYPTDPFTYSGVCIKVQNLNREVRDAFSNPEFITNLHRTLTRDYMLHLNRGLNIVLNGSRVDAVGLSLRSSDEFAPLRTHYTDSTDPSVKVEIIGGMAAEPPDDVNPTEDDRSDRRYGWYIACNGRMVLAADKTQLSGWGTDGWQLWHRQYSGFLGVVHFTSPNADGLPLTTTKRNVDTTSEVYRRARTKMRTLTKQWIQYTNDRKSDVERARKTEEATNSVRLYDVKTQPEAVLPEPRRASVPRANVNYSVPRKRMKALAAGLGNISMAYRDVGIKSFEYTYEEFVEDD